MAEQTIIPATNTDPAAAAAAAGITGRSGGAGAAGGITGGATGAGGAAGGALAGAMTSRSRVAAADVGEQADVGLGHGQLRMLGQHAQAGTLGQAHAAIKDGSKITSGETMYLDESGKSR